MIQKIHESEFTEQVLEMARLFGWRSAHFRPAMTEKGWRTAVQGDGAGFPDTLLLRGPKMLVAELKRSRKEKTTHEQDLWLLAFRAAGIEAVVWTPEDWDEIEQKLR